MKKNTYYIEGIEQTVYTTSKQKDILDILDELLVNERNGYENCFVDDTFYIEYKDGTYYEKNFAGEIGAYKKKNISKILYSDAFDTIVYGSKYDVNEYGLVTLK